VAEEWIVYRVSWVYYEDPGPQRKTVHMDVSAHPLRSAFLVKHQVWLLLSQKGYDLDPTEGSIQATGTETSTESGVGQ